MEFSLSVAELAAEVQDLIDSIQNDIEAHNERIALRFVDDGKSTTERAQEALTRPERFRGEHAVAMAWLKENADVVWTVK